MILAHFRHGRGLASLPMTMDMLLQGFDQAGFSLGARLRALNNLNRGLGVIVGPCLVKKSCSPPPALARSGARAGKRP